MLSVVGYKNGICAQDQNQSVQNAVIYLFSPVPICFAIISAIVIYFYSITEKVAQENQHIILQLKQ